MKKLAIFHEEKEFVKLWLAQVFSQLALNTFNFILALAVYESTKSNQSVSLVVISYGLAAFLFGVAAGVIVDHLNLKKVLFITTIARFFVVLIFLLFTGSFWGTLLVAFLLNAVSQFFFPAESASIPSIVGKRNLLFANSLYTMSYYVTQVVGYLGAGALIGAFGYEASITIIASLFLLSALFIYIVDIPRKNNLSEIKLSHVHGKIVRGFRECLLYIKEKSDVQSSLIYLGGSQVIVGMFVSLLPGYAAEVLVVDVHKTGLYLIGPSILGMITAGFVLNILSKYLSREVILKWSVIGAAVSVFLLSFRFEGIGIDLVIASGVAMFAVGLFNSSVVIISNTNLQSQTTENMRGRMYGVLQTIVTVFAVLPVLLSGYLADSFGVKNVLVIVGLFILIIGIIADKRISKLV